VKLKLSDRDRAIIATTAREVPIQGTEDAVLARYKLTETLRLEQLAKATKGKAFDELGRELTFTAELGRDQVEQLIALVAGGGGGLKGEAVPVVGELITRIRQVAPRKEPPKENEAP
jgi:hypothetical protein